MPPMFLLKTAKNVPNYPLFKPVGTVSMNAALIGQKSGSEKEQNYK